MRVDWLDGSQGEANGYAVVASQMRQALEHAGAEMTAGPLDAYDVRVAVSLPDPSLLATGYVQTKTVWHTMLEVSALPEGWAALLNRCGLVWVPSTWVQELFQACGVVAPIAVVGYGVDPAVFHANGRLRNDDGPMRFGVWGDALGTRKHVELGVKAWQEACLADATLEVKITDTTAGPYWVEEGRELRSIRVFRGPWPRELVADWLRSLDCLIYLSGGEGFGLMPLEAMACGTPVVCAYNTGMMDFLSDLNAITVRRHWPEPAPTYTARFGSEFQPLQLLPDFDEAVAAIRWAAGNRGPVMDMIGRQAAMEAAGWTWQAAGQAFYGLLQNRMGVAV